VLPSGSPPTSKASCGSDPRRHPPAPATRFNPTSPGDCNLCIGFGRRPGTIMAAPTRIPGGAWGRAHRSLRCRSHGRRFGLDGCLLSMPEFEGVEGFPTEEDNLPQLALESWGPFSFASLDPTMPFAEWIGPVVERTGWMPVDRFRPAPASDLIEANWARWRRYAQWPGRCLDPPPRHRKRPFPGDHLVCVEWPYSAI
jgi:hypothetical protein